MTDDQWKKIKSITHGTLYDPLPIGFIIDSPWIPNWYGVPILDYFTNDEIWIESNLKATKTFPQVLFFPGFWSEFGMCTEPSAFGARCSFPPNQFPHAHSCITSMEDIGRIQKPNPEEDGLNPFLLNRLKLNKPKIEESGHKIRFSVSRGHLNIASYLLGTTELMTGMLTHPDQIHGLLRIITDYLKEWHDLQKETFPSIDGIMILDDMIGFIGEEEFKQFGLPYLKEMYNREMSIKLFHNDAQCHSSVKYYQEIGINVFNMAFDTSLNELKELTNNSITMLGNIPPRDVLANGSEEEIAGSVKKLISSLDDKSRVIISCGGGMPPGVTTEKINAFIRSVQEASTGVSSGIPGNNKKGEMSDY